MMENGDQRFSWASAIGAGMVLLAIVFAIRLYNSVCPNCHQHFTEHKKTDIDWWYLVRGYTTKKCHSCGAHSS
jgi:hypothetical protein